MLALARGASEGEMDPINLAVCLGIIVVIVFFGLVAGKVQTDKLRIGASSAKFPPSFSSSLSRKEVLAAVEERVTNIQSIRHKWKTTDKVEKLGRYQAMLTVPFNLAGDNVKVSYLLNLLATSKDAGGCTVEWSYVAMSELSDSSTQVAVLENEIFKNTTLEIRSALFIAQGDAEEAEYLTSKTVKTPPQLEPQQAHEPLTVRMERSEQSHPHEDSSTPAPEPAVAAEPAPAVVEEPIDIVVEALSKVSNADTLDTPLANTSDVPVPKVGSLLPEVNAKLPDVNLQTPESIYSIAGMDLDLGEVPNTLNFSPPDPTLSSTASQANDSKCIKCSQDRDPSFAFCLYCGHSDP